MTDRDKLGVAEAGVDDIGSTRRPVVTTVAYGDYSSAVVSHQRSSNLGLKHSF